VLTPDLLGAGVRVDHRFKPWLSAFALAEAGYSPDLGRFDYLGMGGLRVTWGGR
jgi:hypothetical protein